MHTACSHEQGRVKEREGDALALHFALAQLQLQIERNNLGEAPKYPVTAWKLTPLYI